MNRIIPVEYLKIEKEFSYDDQTYKLIYSPLTEIGFYKMDSNDGMIQLTNFAVSHVEQFEKKNGILLIFWVHSTDGKFTELIFNPDQFYYPDKMEKILRNKLGLRIKIFSSTFLKTLPNLIETVFIPEFTSPKEPEPLIQLNTIYCIGYKDIEVMREEDGSFHYYYLVRGGVALVSDFIVLFENEIITPGERRNVHFSGEILYDHKRIPFKNLDIATLSNFSSLKRFLIKAGGLDIALRGHVWPHLPACIMEHNSYIDKLKTKEFGYSEDLESYNTENLQITSESILEMDNPMSYDEFFGVNKLRFNVNQERSIKEIKRNIIDKLLQWDEPEVMYPALAFAMLPLIYPWLKNTIPNKFYLMLVGASGSGKSLIAKWMQRFYGQFDSLLSWTSTEASLSYAGHIAKDALIAIDDFKTENFRSASDIKWVMRLLQNYSDVTGRQRAQGTRRLSKEKLIRGFVLISAEDVVITQASTLARGLIVDVASKRPMTEKADEINELSRDFTVFTSHYIQHLINTVDEKEISEIYTLSRDIVADMVDERNYSLDNRMRIIQNLIVLSSSWGMLKNYLFDDEEEKGKHTKIFLESMHKLLESTFERVDNERSYERFVEGLWDLAENSRIFIPVDQYTDIRSSKGSIVGCYEARRNGKIKICIKLSAAFNRVNSFLAHQGGIGTSIRTLEDQLLEKGLIRKTSSEIVSFSDQRKIRGVEWIGDYPKIPFGL